MINSCSALKMAESSHVVHEEKENQPPKKKRRLSLSRKGKKKTEDASDRFSFANEEEVEAASKGVIPDNTTKNNRWAENNFVQWMKAREASDDPVPEDLLSCNDPAIVCKWLSRFVLETHQESGKPYPATSIYLLLCGLFRISRSKGVLFNFLDKTDSRFRDLHNTTDSVCSNLHAGGVGAQKKAAHVISAEDEDLFWEKKVMSLETPRSLQNLVFYYVGLHFSLRGGQEQRDLKVNQLRRFPSDLKTYDDHSYYEYVEFISKNNQHRFKDIHGKSKKTKVFALPGSHKCLVKILDFYFSKLPDEPVAFYLRPLQKVPADGKSWYVNVPCGINTLQSIVPKMSDVAETSVRYTNHSFRATSASRLFASNIPKIIQEKTGHRSLVGLRAYERTTTEQERTVTKILSSVERGSGMGLEEPKVEETPLKPKIENEECPRSALVFSGHIQNCTFNFFNK